MKKSILTLLSELTMTKTDQGVVNISSQDPQKDLKIQQAKKDRKSYTLYEEDNLSEMARIAINYKLTPDYKDKLDALNAEKGDKVKSWYSGAVEYLEQVGKADFTTIAREKFDKTQFKFAEYGRNLIKAGIIEPAGMKGEKDGEESKAIPQFQRMTQDEPDEPKTFATFKDDDMFIGGGFTDDFERGNLSGEETPLDDLQPELEPETPTQTNLSDDDYEALMKYLDLRTRFKGVKQDIAKLKRGKSSAGDIKDTGRTPEMQKLIQRKNDLETRIGQLVLDNEYLQKRVAKEDDIDTINEVKDQLIERMQKLANIVRIND